MTPQAKNFSGGKEPDAGLRKRYAKGKLQQEAQRASATVSECDQLLARLRKLGASGSGSKLLDLGCGTGRLTIPLAKRGYDVYGTDINSDVVSIARDKAQEGNVSAHFTVAQAETLPFSDDIFEICIADSVLEHVADWKKTLDEVARVLKKGGIAYFDAANAFCPIPTEVKYIPFYGLIPGRLRRWITSVLVARCPSLVGYSPTPAQHWFTPTGLRKALSRAGFNRSWDLFDITTKDDIPPRYRFASPLLILLKKIPRLYVRDVAHLPLSAVRLFCQKG
jgi:2-polyprenyl-3-methyl-5-hydroxy-6-metoxy-1,4-benzoquinol methylase